MVNDGNSVPATGAPIALLSQTNTSLGGIICYCEAQTEKHIFDLATQADNYRNLVFMYQTRKHEAISCVHLFCSMYLQRYTSQLYQ